MHLRYVILYVADVGATMDFYARAFGLDVRYVHEGGDYGEMATGETRLAFSSIALMQSLGKQVATAAPGRPSFELAFATGDVPAALDRALAAGAVLVQEATDMPWGQTSAMSARPKARLSRSAPPRTRPTRHAIPPTIDRIAAPREHRFDATRRRSLS